MVERFDRVSGLLNLVRWQGRGLRGEYSAVRGILEGCFTAVEVGVPEDFISAGLCVLETAAKRIDASVATVRADFPKVFEYQRMVEAANSKMLAQVRRHLEEARQRTDEVLLMGDPAVLLGLFESLGAFRAQTWAIGVSGSGSEQEEMATETAVMAVPFEIRFGRLGKLEARLDEWSEIRRYGDSNWRVPSRELLLVLLAARVGEPEADPAAGTWAHLAAALKGMRDEIDLDEVLGLAEELELSERVHRGLAIVSSLFPELGRIIPAGRLSIPTWERVALRVAANRVIKTAVGNGE